VTQPSLLGLQILLELSAPDVTAHEPSSVAELDEAALRSLVKRQAEKMSRYVCSVCGFRAQHYYWQCPGCSRWDSYSPRRTEELESSV
jgi:lipopolysaccharide biosynthesis regulator YciM